MSDTPKQRVYDSGELKELWHYNLTNHKPTAEGIRRIEMLRSAGKAFADAIIDLTPPGRDQALALTSLESTLFHSNAAIARNMNEDLVAADAAEEKRVAEEKAHKDEAATGDSALAEPIGDAAPDQPTDKTPKEQ